MAAMNSHTSNISPPRANPPAAQKLQETFMRNAAELLQQSPVIPEVDQQHDRDAEDVLTMD